MEWGGGVPPWLPPLQRIAKSRSVTVDWRTMSVCPLSSICQPPPRPGCGSALLSPAREDEPKLNHL